VARDAAGRRGKALKKVYPMVSGSGGVMDHTDPSLRSWDLARIVLGVTTIGGLTLASFWVLRPFLLAAIWATMIVVSTWPTLRAEEARVWGTRSLAVTVMTFAMLLVIAAPAARPTATCPRLATAVTILHAPDSPGAHCPGAAPGRDCGRRR